MLYPNSTHLIWKALLGTLRRVQRHLPLEVGALQAPVSRRACLVCNPLSPHLFPQYSLGRTEAPLSRWVPHRSCIIAKSPTFPATDSASRAQAICGLILKYTIQYVAELCWKSWEQRTWRNLWRLLVSPQHFSLPGPTFPMLMISFTCSGRRYALVILMPIAILIFMWGGGVRRGYVVRYKVLLTTGVHVRPCISTEKSLHW